MKKLDYTHRKEKRHNNPPAGIAPGISKEPKKKAYSASLIGGERLDDYAAKHVEDLHDYPILEWFNKHETDDIVVDVLPLHVHESIHPATIIRPAIDTGQSALDDFFGEQRSFKEAVEFYEHEDGWTNRMILGDSLHVMTSMLENEPAVAGRVQMIYFDPPYGFNYKSNFQPFFTKRKNAETQKNKGIEWRPEPITAFRDTWDYGVHSYLTTIRKRLLVAREILADTGSIFFQISNENVHRVRLILDEVFGVENFMWEILFQTSNGAGPATHPTTYDYILWYAKDKNALKKSGKLHQLYLDRTDKQLEAYSSVHMPDGSIIPLPKSGKIPRGGQRCAIRGHLHSQNTSPTTARLEPHKFPNGIVIPPPPGRQWVVNHEGLDKLYHLKRLYFTENYVSFITYPDDYPTIMDNVWSGMSILSEKIYDVQTKSTVLERCMTMCSDPGDLVLDITGGSGVTAYAAEKHGRRWITCDVSKLSIAIATCRMQTSVFPWYKLKNESAGICGDLEYESFEKRSIGALTEESLKINYRYDRPIEEKKRSRITGPFTVEAIPSPIVLSVKEQVDDSTRKRWSDELLGAGVVTNEGRVKFKKLDRNEKKESPIHYIGIATDGRRMAISFGPRDAPMSPAQVESAIKESKLHDVDSILMVATTFSPEAKDLIWNPPLGLKIIGAEAHNDLLIPELASKDSNNSFVQIGRPRVDIVKNKDGTMIVRVLGYDYFDANSGKITSEGADEVAMWMLDTDYDGRTIRAKQMFFPGKREGVQKLAKKLAKTMRSSELNKDLLKKYMGTESLPFKPGNYKQIAVKIIDYKGRESIKHMRIDSW